MFFPDPVTLLERNRAMAAECAEIAPALGHLKNFLGLLQLVTHRSPCRPNDQVCATRGRVWVTRQLQCAKNR